MQSQRESSSVPAGPDGGGNSSPGVLLPVSAEDFAKHRRRTRSVIAVAIVVVLAAAGYIYKRSTDPLRARESYDAGLRLFGIARYTQSIIALDSAIGYQSDFWERSEER